MGTNTKILRTKDKNMKNFEKAALITFLALGTCHTLVAKKSSGGGKT